MDDSNKILFGIADRSIDVPLDAQQRDQLNILIDKIQSIDLTNIETTKKFVAFLTYLALKTLPQDANSELNQIISEKNYRKLFEILIKHDPRNILVISEFFLL